jgi:hypothetical protein
MMCAFIFYFAYRSTFKFEFESKEFEDMKGFIKRKRFSISVLVLGPNPSCQPSWPGAALPPARPSLAHQPYFLTGPDPTRPDKSQNQARIEVHTKIVFLFKLILSLLIYLNNHQWDKLVTK